MPDTERKSVSASQAAALFDASPYLTRWMLYRYLAGDELDKGESDNRMDWGTRMEPLLLEAGAADLRLQVVRDQLYVRRGTLGATRDAQIIDPSRGPGAFDTKVCFDYRQWMQRWSGGQQPPVDIEIQLQTQMYVGDGTAPFRWGVIGVWLAGEMKYFEREPVPSLWEKLEAESQRILADVADKREPDPFGAVVEVPLLKELYPEVLRKTRDLRADPAAKEHAETAKMHQWAAAQRLHFEKVADQTKAKLLGLAQDCDEVLLPAGVVVSVKKTPTAERVTRYKAGIRQTVTIRQIEGQEEELPAEPSTILGA